MWIYILKTIYIDIFDFVFGKKISTHSQMCFEYRWGTAQKKIYLDI